MVDGVQRMLGYSWNRHYSEGLRTPAPVPEQEKTPAAGQLNSEVPWMRFFHRFLPLCGLLALCSAGSATTIVVNPSTITADPNSTTIVRIGFSNVGDVNPQPLGSYDLQLFYNPSLLILESLNHGDPVYGNQLDLSGYGSLTWDDTSTPGEVRMMEVSFDDPATLRQFQRSQFVIASLAFRTLGTGSSPLTLEVNTISDALGNIMDTTTAGGSISVGTSSVPEPGMLVLLGSGLGALGLWRRKGRANG